MKKLLIISFLMIAFVSCNDSKVHENSVSLESINEYLQLNKTPIKNDTKVVVIIPNGGCSGCNSEIERILAENIELIKDKSIIVFTDIDDKKRLINSYSNTSFLKNSNVILDVQNDLKLKGFISFYPEVLILDKMKLRSRGFVEPHKKDIVKLMNETLDL